MQIPTIETAQNNIPQVSGNETTPSLEVGVNGNVPTEQNEPVSEATSIAVVPVQTVKAAESNETSSNLGYPIDNTNSKTVAIEALSEKIAGKVPSVD